MVNVTEGLVEELHQEVGDALRAVAEYDRGDFDLKYIRDDVEAEYTDEEIAEVYRQLEIEGMGYSNFETLFHTGRLEYVMYGFEDAIVFHLPEDEFSGLELTTDRDLTIDPESIIDICKSAIE